MTVERDFKFSVPIEIIKGRKEGEWRVGGIATDQESPDLQGEEVLVDGLNVDYLTQRGSFNWDHGKGPEDIIGEIDVAKKIEENKKLYVEGVLYPEVDRAKAVYNLLRSLKDAGSKRKLGLSLEGKIQERDETGKQIKKAWIKNVAVTYHPINQGTYVDFLKSDVEFERMPIKADEIKDEEKVEKADEKVHWRFKEPVGATGEVTGKQNAALNAEPKSAASEPLGKGQNKDTENKEEKLETEPVPDPHKEIGLTKADGAVPDGPSPTDVGMSAGYERNPLRKQSLEQKAKVTTYGKKDLFSKKKKDGKIMTKSDVAELLGKRGYDNELATKLSDIIFARTTIVNLIKSSDRVAEALADLLIKAAQVKGYVRTRRGKLERVSPYTKELTHELHRINSMTDEALITRARKISHPDKLLHFYHAAKMAGKMEVAGAIKAQGSRLGLTSKDFESVAESVAGGIREAEETRGQSMRTLSSGGGIQYTRKPTMFKDVYTEVRLRPNEEALFKELPVAKVDKFPRYNPVKGKDVGGGILYRMKFNGREYLVDTQGADYPRYVTRVVTESEMKRDPIMRSDRSERYRMGYEG